MKIEINVRKAHLYFFVAVLVMLSAIILTYAAVDRNKGWHAAETISITIDGVEMSLQEAISGMRIDADHAKTADTAAFATVAERISSAVGGSVTCSWGAGAHAFRSTACNYPGCGMYQVAQLTVTCSGGILTSVSMQCVEDQSCIPPPTPIN